MSSKTKIVVLHMKEIIYTAIFVILGVLFILLLVFMFFPKNRKNIGHYKRIYTGNLHLHSKFKQYGLGNRGYGRPIKNHLYPLCQLKRVRYYNVSSVTACNRKYR